MAKGWPDYTRVTGIVENYDEYALNYPVGLGDAAARMGSIKTYDPRGRVAWMDDFEATILHWDTFNAGPDGSQALDTAYCRNGNQSCRLTSNTGIGTSEISRYLSRPRNVNLGIEMHFSAAANFDTLSFYLRLWDGAVVSETGMMIREAPAQIEYQNAGGGLTNTGFLPCLSGELTHFHDVKMVYDFQALEYKRVMYDYQELDLSGQGVLHGGSGLACGLQILINNHGDGVNSVPIYIDDVILTYMEP